MKLLVVPPAEVETSLSSHHCFLFFLPKPFWPLDFQGNVKRLNIMSASEEIRR
jgi:hypothetical protein